MAVAEIANAAAQKESWAVKALKMLTQAGSRGEGKKNVFR
jgi:hypothetical protein